MSSGRGFISAELDRVNAGVIDIGNKYYLPAERPGLHVGVPPVPTHFIGREILVGDVARRLIAGSSLALSADGMPGVGKTTLAVALAYRREVLNHFTDGVLWGGLGLQPNVMEVLASWASSLGVDASQATEPSKRAELVRNAIGQRRFLLVIDDAWAPAEDAQLLRCGGPNCAHFLTTRDESIARVFADPHGAVGIHELEPADALKLLQALAPEACNAEPEAAGELVRAVGYLPLAIELMGAYLSATENRYFREQQATALRAMADPAERLRQMSRRLGDGRGTEVTLRETISLSLEGLSDAAITAFYALGAFAPKPETFDAAAALEVTGTTLGTLSRLIGRHLLEKQDDALSLHQTVADVARERCPADVVGRHAGHFLQRVAEAGDDWRIMERIYGQVKWSFTRLQDAVSVLSFTSALRSYQSLRGLRADAMHWSDAEISAAREVNDDARLAKALSDRGWLHDQLREPSRALEYYEQALPLRRAVGDLAGEATTLNNIGAVYDGLAEWSRALEYFKQALPIRRAVDDRRGEATTLNNIGRVYIRLGDLSRALEYYEQALPLLHATGDRAGEATTLNNIGRVYASLGEHDRALEYFEQALPLRRAVGDRVGEATSLNNVGGVYASLGEHGRALEYYGQALLLMRAVGDPVGEAVTLNNIGAVYDGLGEHDRALEYYAQALPLRRAAGDRQGEASTLNNIGTVYGNIGEREKALEYLDQALLVFLTIGDPVGEAVTRSNVAAIYRSTGRLKEAVTELRQAVELKAAVQYPDLERSRRVLADVEAELRRE